MVTLHQRVAQFVRAPVNKADSHLPEESIRIVELSWACSSAGRAPALQARPRHPILQSLECRPALGASNPFEFTAVHS
jgi:hypothetical protein